MATLHAQEEQLSPNLANSNGTGNVSTPISGEVSMEHSGSVNGSRLISVGSTSDSEWHLHFMIPDASAFSGSVQKAIKTGIVTAKARREINLVLRTYVLAHTIYPTSEQYNTVCRNLVTKFPKLKDDSEKGQSIYVSIHDLFNNGCNHAVLIWM